MSRRIYKLPQPPFNNPSDNLAWAMFSGGESIGYEQILVSNSITQLNPPAEAVWALICVEKQSTYTGTNEILARFRQDKVITNTDLTATVGMPLCNFAVVEIKDTDNLAKIRFIGTDSNIAILNVEYYA